MFSLCLYTNNKIANAVHILPVKLIFKIGIIIMTDNEAIIDDKDTYFDIFNTRKKTTKLSIAQTGAIHKKYPIHVDTALPPLNCANTGQQCPIIHASPAMYLISLLKWNIVDK